MKIAVILGTRPEIIKMSPVVRELETRSIDFFILHTGQHYSYNLDRVFFEQLKLPQAKYNLEVGSGSHAEETAKILVGVENILQKESPDITLVEGDTNSVLAGALAATKLHLKVGHVEAGLRSYDRNMPEEINRILTDHCSDYLFAPTENARAILLGEGIPEDKISVTGKTIVDAVYQNLELARKRSGFDTDPTVIARHKVPRQSPDSGLPTLDSRVRTRDSRLRTRDYFLLTLHRAENVDNMERLSSILEGLGQIGARYNLPVIYPIHPRTRKMMSKFNLKPKNLELIEPVDFLDFLRLESNARLILTDSGGVQEESCILGVPCVTLRDNTERPETLEVGSNVLAGTLPDKIVESVHNMLGRGNSWNNPFGDGKAAEKIVRSLESKVGSL